MVAASLTITPREEVSSLAQQMTVLGIMLCPHLYSTDLNGSRLLGTCDPAGEFSTAIWPLSRRLLQLLKRGLARVGTRLTAAPPHHPREVHHGRTGTMLQMRVREAAIARAAQATDTDARREGPLDSSASCLLGLKLRRRLAVPIREQRLVLLTGPDGQGAPDSPGTLGSRRAIAAVATGELDVDDVVITVIDRRGPTEARMPGGTGHPLPLPVDHKATEVKRALHTGLPAHAASHRTTEIKGIVALADGEPFGIDVACIDDMI